MTGEEKRGQADGKCLFAQSKRLKGISMSHSCHPCRKREDKEEEEEEEEEGGRAGMNQSQPFDDDSNHDELLRESLERDGVVVEEGVRNDKGSLSVLRSGGGVADRDACSCSNAIIGSVSWCC